MNLVRLKRIFALVVGAILLTACATSPTKHALDPADRSPAGGREAIVMVPQGELRALVNQSKGGQAFGLIGALVDVSVTQHRANAAESALKSVRDGLNGYNFDQRVLAATQATVDKLDWLGVHKVTFSKDASNESSTADLDKSESPEVIFAVYEYALTADFSAVQVSARVTISPKKVPAGSDSAARIKVTNAAYSQAFQCMIRLAGADGKMTDNAQHWSADNAKLIRDALDQGIERVSTLMQRSLLQTPSDVQKLSQGEETTVGDSKGKVIEKTDGGTLLVDLAGTWVYVVTAPVG
jgi:hypothetical protein